MASVPSHIIWPTRLTAADRCRWPVLIVPSKETDPQLNPWRASLAGAKWPFPSVSIQTVYDTNPSRVQSVMNILARVIDRILHRGWNWRFVSPVTVAAAAWRPLPRWPEKRNVNFRVNFTLKLTFHYSVHSRTATWNRPAITLSVVVK